jgi:hypothetical protein
MEWEQYFEQVSDFRIERSKRHKLSDILMLSLCAVLPGAEDYEEIARHGRQKEAFLRQFLALPIGFPSHDPINRALTETGPGTDTSRPPTAIKKPTGEGGLSDSWH